MSLTGVLDEGENRVGFRRADSPSASGSSASQIDGMTAELYVV